MKKCLTTLMDDNFVVGFEGFWKSFIVNNPWFKHDFVVFDAGLSERNKLKIKSYYENTIFRDINFLWIFVAKLLNTPKFNL